MKIKNNKTIWKISKFENFSYKNEINSWLDRNEYQ